LVSKQFILNPKKFSNNLMKGSKLTVKFKRNTKNQNCLDFLRQITARFFMKAAQEMRINKSKVNSMAAFKDFST